MTDDARKHEPLESWTGAFGAAYIARNQPDPDAIAEAADVFGRILAPDIRADINSILEVGANVGINLAGLRRVLGPGVLLSAVEPNPAACDVLRANASLGLRDIVQADAYHTTLPDAAFDLTFTNGVLIHIPPARLPGALREITRVSRRYVLCSEYFSHTPVELAYRGKSGLLWKRDFGAAYLDACPELRIVRYGFTWMVEFPHFDNLNWWLFEKIG